MDDEIFKPELVDEQTTLTPQLEDGSDKRMIEQLHQFYEQQSHMTAQDIEIAWNQLVIHSQASQNQRKNHMRSVHSDEVHSTRPFVRSSKSRTFAQRLTLAALVACMLILVGSTAIVFHVARQSKPTVTGHGASNSITVIATPTLKPATRLGSTLYTYLEALENTAASDNAINSVSWSPDGKRIVSTSTTMQVWDATSGGHLLVRQPLEDANFFVSRWSPDGKRIATAVPFVEVWNAATGKTIVSCPYPDAVASTTGASPSTIPFSSTQREAHATYLSAKTTLKPLSAGPFPPMLSWSPDGKYIAIPYQKPTNPEIVVLDASSCKVVTTFQGHTDIGFDVEWSPDGKYIASASADETIEVWEFATHRLLYTYHDPFNLPMYRLAWSPDGKRIASTDSTSNTVEVWDAFTGQHQIVYRGHSQAVNAIAWSPDGKRIASGSSVVQKNGKTTGDVQLWNPTTGQHLFSYQENPGIVFAVAWSPDGKLIASADGLPPSDYSSNEQHTVKVWRAV